MIWLGILWALPWTAVGLFFGGITLITGGSARRADRMLEFYGGWLPWFLDTFPLVKGARAVTFGHTVIARSDHDASACRDHERVHVRQYERWGIFFGFAYVLCWVWLWARGRDPYRDHPFEREAFDHERSIHRR